MCKQPLQGRRLGWVVALLALFALAGTACSSGAQTSTSASSRTGGATASTGSSAGAPAVDYSKLSGTLDGTGSSFQDAFDQKIITGFKTKAPGVTVTYTKSGSSAGKQDLQNGVVQFAGTDSLIKDEDKPKYKGDVLYFPTVAAPITVSYNLSGVTKLQLSGETLAGIFSTAIKTWSDPKIAADNPGVALPSTPITVVHRSDGSGTTNNFTKFLAAAGGSAWTLGNGDTVNWDPSTQGAEKNSGVAGAIKAANGGIGYVDLADAVNAGLSTAAIKNKAGSFVEPKLPGASAALAGTTVNADLTYNPIDAAGADSYPITSPTWIIVYKKQADQARADALKGFLTYILTEGQKAANSVGFAALPSDLASKALAQIDQITVG